jgi:hypothetical protein
MLCFGFVSGHDFSRAVNDEGKLGFSPCYSFPADKEKAQGLKPRSLLGLSGPTKVVP